MTIFWKKWRNYLKGNIIQRKYDNYIHTRFTAQHNCHNCKLRQNSCFTSSCSTEVLNYGHASWHAAYKAPALVVGGYKSCNGKKCRMKRKGKKNVFIIDCIICRNKFSDKNCLFILLLFLQNACVKKYDFLSFVFHLVQDYIVLCINK